MAAGFDRARRHGSAPSVHRRGPSARSDDRRARASASARPPASPSPASGASAASGHSEATKLVSFLMAAWRGGLADLHRRLEILGARAPDAAMAGAALDHRDRASRASGAASRPPWRPCSAPAHGRRDARVTPPSSGCRPGARPPSWRCRRRIRQMSNVACDSRSTAGSSGRISGHSNFSISAQDGVSAIDVVALVDPGQQRRRRPGAPLRRRLRDRPAPACGMPQQRGIDDLGLDAVLGQHRARGRADAGVVVVDEAGGVEHRLALPKAGAAALTAGALRARRGSRRSRRGYFGRRGVAMDAGDLLEQRPRQLVVASSRRPVGERRRRRCRAGRCGRSRPAARSTKPMPSLRASTAR